MVDAQTEMFTKERAADQISKAMMPLPAAFVAKVKNAIGEVEAVLKRPPSLVEFFVYFVEEGNAGITSIYQACGIAMSLLREDEIYCSEGAEFFSLTPHEGFKNYSDWIRMHFTRGEIIAEDGTVKAGTARTVNFNQLAAMMKSTDASLLEEMNWIYDGDFKFLDGEDMAGQRTSFLSFPRSGNSMLRREFEKISGIASGSSTMIHTSTLLQVVGLKGESLVDDTVWPQKAHHPLMYGAALPFNSNKTFAVIRNPMDSVVSFFTLIQTVCHQAQLPFQCHEEFPEWWAWYVKKFALKWKLYHQLLMKECLEDSKNPLYIVRFEDLINKDKKAQEMTDLFRFIFGIADATGTNLERRVAAAMGQEGSVYKLKKTSGKKNAHLAKFQQDGLLEFVKEQLKEEIYFFGYANAEGNTETDVFTYDEHEPAMLEKFNGFRRVNEASMAKVLDPAYTPVETSRNVDLPDPLLDAEDMQKGQDPYKQWTKQQLQKAKEAAAAETGASTE